MPDSAVVARLELAERMREYREASGETARVISSRLGFSPNYLSALEHGREVLSADKLSELGEVYELSSDELEQVASLIATSKIVGWWEQSPFGELASDEIKMLCGLEQGATSALVFEGTIVTGLLQTEAYAEALIAADALNSRATIRNRVALRIKRQERLRGVEPLNLTVIMSEAALMQQIGGKEVLRGQLEHLAQLIDSLADSLSVRIQSFEADRAGHSSVRRRWSRSRLLTAGSIRSCGEKRPCRSVSPTTNPSWRRSYGKSSIGQPR